MSKPKMILLGKTEEGAGSSSLLRGLLLATGLVLSLGLASCGGGADTKDTGGEVGGPPPGASSNGNQTADMRAFKLNVWDNLAGQNRCGQCHGVGQGPEFVDLDVAKAYSEAITVVDLTNAANSRLATKVSSGASGHNCWLPNKDDCATEITNYINGWINGTTNAPGRAIQLDPPVIKDPGATKNYPASPAGFTPVHNLLTQHCAACHTEAAGTSPFFANADIASAYEAAKIKMDLNTPANSRLVVRLREESHNCWSIDCQADATEVENAIISFASGIIPTTVDPALIISKALTLGDSTIASGGNRHEANLIALWEFSEGSGTVARDTSGVISVDVNQKTAPLNLNLSGSVSWVGGYGVNIKTGGKLQSNATVSKKLYDFIKASEEYSIEGWVVPANVTQVDSAIVSYGANAVNRNMLLGQTLYNYDYFNRSDNTVANNNNVMSTPDADEDLQASLQHVVATYDPINGRKIYINGQLTNATDSVAAPGDSLASVWDDVAILMLGATPEVGHQWTGKIRMLAIHNRALTPAQVLQNFDVGVGQKYFMLFSIADKINVPDTYIMFEVAQFDDYSYFFSKPTFINLDSSWTPTADIAIKDIRIGINGKEAVVGQAYARLTTSVTSSSYVATGQLLSRMGTVIAVEAGPASDEFFLTFEQLGSNTHVYVEAAPTPPAAPADKTAVSDIGLRTFEEINQTLSDITGISTTNSAVNKTYTTYKQQFPSTEQIDTFLPSHQMAIAQLAMGYCNERVKADKLLAVGNASRFFTNFNFAQTAAVAFDDASEKNNLLDPLLSRGMNAGAVDLTTQPAEAEIRDMLTLPGTGALDLDAGLSGDSYSSLVTVMTACAIGGSPTCNTTARTDQVVIAACTAVLGSAVMLVQ